MPTKSIRKIAGQLENRKRNLAVIEETIRLDDTSGQKLIPVREFLTERIQLLENELRVSN